MMSTFKEVQSLEKEYAECEAKLASAGDDAEAMQGALDRMAELQVKLDNADAGSVEKKVDRILGSMGFAPGDADLPVSAFSGGWKMRMSIAISILHEPELLLLDEPTNHLDRDAIEWLEKHLLSLEGVRLQRNSAQFWRNSGAILRNSSETPPPLSR